ncbi:MAG: NAD(P)/FAD-dependent oxidoreductase [Pseudomonadota bacterium]
MTDGTRIAIIGGGPAGLAAALTLARAEVASIVIDAPTPPRNAASRAIGNLPGHDGIAPDALRDKMRDELAAYGCVDFVSAPISSVDGSVAAGFQLYPAAGSTIEAARIILACGRVDIYPEVEGFREYWAKSIHNCPYCGGYDARGTPWGIVINRPEMIGIVEIYAMWSDDLILFLEPEISIDPDREQALAARGIGVEKTPISAILGDGTRMRAVALADGRQVSRSALNWWPKMRLPDLVQGMDLTQTARGEVAMDGAFATSWPGVYAAGDLTYTDHQTVATAIHQGGACAASLVFQLAMAR